MAINPFQNFMVRYGAGERIFTEGDLDIMRLVRSAFDTQGLCNPEKVFPTPGRCGETRIRTGGKAQATYVKADVGEAW